MYLQHVLLLDRFRFYQLLTWYNKFIQQQGFVCAPKDQRVVFTTQSYTFMHRYCAPKDQRAVFTTQSYTDMHRYCAPKDQRAVFTTQSYTDMHRYIYLEMIVV